MPLFFLSINTYIIIIVRLKGFMKRVLYPIQYIEDTEKTNFFYFKMELKESFEDVMEKINNINEKDKIEKVVILVKDFIIDEETKQTLVDILANEVNNNSLLEIHIIKPKKVYDIPETEVIFYYLTSDMSDKVKYFDKPNHCTIAVEDLYSLNPLSNSMLFNP